MGDRPHPTGYRSGELARAAGVSADTLRHYERRGLLARPDRLANGYRLYPHDSLGRVRVIQRGLSFGFTLDELARFLRAREAGHPPCRDVRALAAQRLEDLERQIAELVAFRDELAQVIRNWDRRLAKGRESQPARLLETLAPSRVGSMGAPSLKGVRFARRLRRKEMP